MTVFVSTSVRTSECVCVFACLSVSFHPFLMLSMSSVSRCIIIEMILTTHLNQLLHTKDQAHTYTRTHKTAAALPNFNANYLLDKLTTANIFTHYYHPDGAEEKKAPYDNNVRCSWILQLLIFKF